jgi:hypothetical protein
MNKPCSEWDIFRPPSFLTRNAIANLKREWQSFSIVKKGGALKALMMAGCSSEDLAADFHCTIQGVSRLIRIADLRCDERDAIEAGADPDDYLLADKRRRKREKESWNLYCESKDGRPSTRLSIGIVRFLAVRVPAECCRNVYFKGTLFDEVDYRIRILAENPSAKIPPETWIAEESKTVSQHFVILDPSGNPPPPNRDNRTPLEKLVMQLVSYVRCQPCLSIIQTALVKASELLQAVSSYPQELLIWRAKILTRAEFTKLLNEKLAPQNLLADTSEALVA